MVNDCFTELIGEIAGPPDTPYEYGTFVLEIKVPESYPFNPPRVKFVTKVNSRIQSQNKTKQIIFFNCTYRFGIQIFHL